ncbi:unnamed protein product [Arabidopsis halleri]
MREMGILIKIIFVIYPATTDHELFIHEKIYPSHPPPSPRETIIQY